MIMIIIITYLPKKSDTVEKLIDGDLEALGWSTICISVLVGMASALTPLGLFVLVYNE